MILKSLGRPQWRAVNSTTQPTEVLVTRRKPAAKACRAAFFSKVGWLPRSPTFRIPSMASKVSKIIRESPPL